MYYHIKVTLHINSVSPLLNHQMILYFNNSEFAWNTLCNVFDPVQTQRKLTESIGKKY